MTSDPTSDFHEQYQALRDGRGIVELAGWSSVSVSGEDRHSFLNNFCTNDIKRLTPGKSCEAFFLNVKGKIVGHGIVSCREDELVVIGVPGQAPALIAHLDRYLIREDVQLRDTSAERSYMLAVGSRLIESEQLRVTQAAQKLAIVPCDFTGSGAERLLELPPVAVAKNLDLLRAMGATLADSAFYSVRIEAGVPLFIVDFDESNFPQEVGRDGVAISFTKGCYLGQETVARIDSLGHVNQRIVGVRFPHEGCPDPNMEFFFGGNRVGQVSSWAYSPQLGTILALSMVRREANSVGKRLESPVGECEVVALPVTSPVAG